MSRWYLRPSRLILLLVAAPAAALVRFLDASPARTIAAVVGVIAIIVGVSLIALEARRNRGESSNRSGVDALIHDPRKVLLGAILTVVVVGVIATVLVVLGA